MSEYTPSRAAVPPEATQEKAFSSLNTEQLVGLQPLLTENWQYIIQSEYERRKNFLATIYRDPEIYESPPYNEQRGALDYLNAIRKSNLKHGILESDFEAQHWQDGDLWSLAADFVWKENKLLQGTRITESFVVATMKALLLTPRVRALQNYRAIQTRIVKSGLPTVDIAHDERGTVSSIELARLTGNDVDRMGPMLNSLRCRTTVPDFFQLDKRHRQEITDQIFSEIRQLATILTKHGSGDIMPQPAKLRPSLAFIAPQELETTINQRINTTTSLICKAFLQAPETFRDAYRPIAETPPLIKPEHRSMTQNQRQIEELLQDPEINESVLDLVPGTTVAITKPGIIMSGSTFDRIIDKHLQLIGRALGERVPHPSPKGIQLFDWEKFDVGASFRAGHYGQLTDLKMTRLDVTEADLRNYWRQGYDPQKVGPETTAKLGLQAEFRSTSGKTKTAVFYVTVMVRNDPRTPDKIRKTKRGSTTTGPQAVKALHEEAMAAGRAAERFALRRTILSGIPGSNK